MKLDIQRFADGRVVIDTELDTSGFENGLDNLDNNSKLDKILKSIKDKFSEIGNSMGIALKSFGKSLKGVAKMISSLAVSAVKMFGKLILGAVSFGIKLTAALGIVGVLALAFLSVMEAVNKVGEENKTLKNDIQYIIFALKSALQPVIDAIANVLVKIISFIITIFKYAMAIANIIAGRNLFEKATPEAFAKSMADADKSSKGVAKNAKEIKKQLAGFDEMNVLSDNSTGGVGGAGSGALDFSTDFDLSNLAEIEAKIREFLDRFKTKWTDILSISKKEAIETFLGSDGVWGKFQLGLFWIEQGFVKVFDGIIKIFKGDFKEGIKEIIDGIITIFLGLVTTVKGFFEGIVKTILSWLSNLINKGVEIFNSFRDKIVNVWTTIKTKILGVIDGIKKYLSDKFGAIGTAIGDVIGSKIKAVVNAILKTAETFLNKPINAINKLIGKINDLPGVKITKLSTFSFPRLAKGGIINMPGRGVAVGGESGREGVIPLTDSQQMALLGEAIGRYITINATIENTMNGRVISRELQKIQNENSFAGNR